MKNDSKRLFASLKRMDTIAIFIGVFAFIGIFVIPLVVTKVSIVGLGVSEPNEIGDTIGGILSPFIGLISSFLVYLALREQIKANEIIALQFEKQSQTEYEKAIFSQVILEYKQIEKEFEEFEIKIDETSIIFGKNAVLNTIEDVLNGNAFEGYKYLESENLTILMKKLNDLTLFFLENVSEEKQYLKILYWKYEKIMIFFNPFFNLENIDENLFPSYYFREFEFVDNWILVHNNYKLLSYRINKIDPHQLKKHLYVEKLNEAYAKWVSKRYG